MTDTNTMALLDFLRNRLEDADADTLKDMVQFMAEGLMSAEADSLCGAEYRKRDAERVNQRNGYRTRRWDTRAGSIQLAIPKLRQGSYFPAWLLDHRKRAERALVAVVAESYLRGVSTRKVDAIVRSLGIEGISKSQASELAKSLDEMVEAFRSRPLDAKAYPYVWLDALEVKCREDGRVVNVACVIAIGVRHDGHREVLGVDVFTTEDGAGWLAFLRSLVARGLKGVQLVTSDAHEGLKNAIAALRGASWQRCRTHFMRNLLARVPRSAQGAVATMVRSIFEQPDAEEVWKQHARIVEQLRGRFEHAAEMLEEAASEILAFTAFPKDHWRRIWSNNPLERLNKEARRRTDVAGIFPNRSAVLRLVGAVLAEQHDEWQVARRYLTIGSLEKLRGVSAPSLPPATTTRTRTARVAKSGRRGVRASKEAA
jgi:transposase-like protein